MRTLFLILTATLAFGQEFDAAAIKPAPADARGGGFNLSPGRLNVKNQNIKELVEFAWDIHEYQVSGGQRWMETERYEIVATFPATTTDAQRALMLQKLLANRFGLVIHRESKDITGFALVTAKNGSKLHESKSDEHPGMMMGRNPNSGLRTLTGTKAPISQLVSVLADLLGRPVEDHTGLTGVCDFTMEWAPDPTIDQPLNNKGAEQGPQTDPTLFTALQETLGLKLESHPTPVQVIVIDHADKPSAN